MRSLFLFCWPQKGERVSFAPQAGVRPFSAPSAMAGLLHPPFSLLAPKKTGRARSKRNRLFQTCPCGQVWENGPVRTAVQMKMCLLNRGQNAEFTLAFRPANPNCSLWGACDLTFFSFRCRCPSLGWGFQREGPRPLPFVSLGGPGAKSKRPRVSLRGRGVGSLFKRECPPQYGGHTLWGAKTFTLPSAAPPGPGQTGFPRERPPPGSCPPPPPPPAATRWWRAGCSGKRAAAAAASM